MVKKILGNIWLNNVNYSLFVIALIEAILFVSDFCQLPRECYVNESSSANEIQKKKVSLLCLNKDDDFIVSLAPIYARVECVSCPNRTFCRL